MVENQESSLVRVFRQRFAGVSVAGEARAGLTTFLTMAYILFINPMILGQAIHIEGVNVTAQLLTATALAAAIGCLAMGLFTNYPFALAPGMGLNAYFTYSLVLGQGLSWQTALGAVFVSGVLFLIISLAGVREVLLNAIPLSLKHAATAGIGCFLATLGFMHGGFVVAHPETLVTMGDPRNAVTGLALFGLLLTLVLLMLRVPGAILIGILAASVLAVVTGAEVFNGAAFSGLANGFVHFPVWPADLFMAMDLSAMFTAGFLAAVFTFLFVDFFDTAGTLFGLSEKAGVLDADGKLPGAKGAFSADALASCLGAVLGTSSTTSYIESASGIEDGGRTGLTAMFTGLFFLISIFFWPLASAVPAAATAPALIVIGAMMMFATGRIQWEHYRESVPALLTILGMPLTSSITNGLSMGIICYWGIHVFSGAFRRLHHVFHLIALLLLARFLFLGVA